MATWKDLYSSDEPLPEGHLYIKSHCNVAGTTFRLEHVTAWAYSSNRSLELERDPDNEHDKNAIKVIGVSEGMRGVTKWHIGYVDVRTATIEIGRSKSDFKDMKVLLRRIAVLKGFFGFGRAKAYAITYAVIVKDT